MSTLLTANFRNYMVGAIVALMALSGCSRFYSEELPPAVVPVVQGNEQQKQGESQAEQHVEAGPVVGAAAEQKVYPVGSCEALRQTYNENTTQAENVERQLTIERHYQRVVRKNCAGDVTSDEVETVKSPRYDFDLKVPLARKFQSVFLFNEATCAHELTTMPVANIPLLGLVYAVTGDGQTKMTIKGDLAPAAFTFRLKEGMNNIFVKYFYDCDATRKVSDYGSDTLSGRPCDENSRTLIVQYPVFVKLVQIELPGVQEIQEPSGGCKR